MNLVFGCQERIEVAEVLDDERMEPALVPRYLRDLEKVNTYLLGTRSVLSHIRPILSARRGDELRVLDIGCGGGEVLRALARHARAERCRLFGVGLDRDPATVSYARVRAREFPELTWICADALALPFAAGSADLVISTTMLHHLPPAQVIDLLRAARSVARGWLVMSDLVRSYPALLAFRVFSRVAAFCRQSREDGLMSVRRAYRPRELAAASDAAGLQRWQLYRHPFSRMTLVCGPPR